MKRWTPELEEEYLKKFGGDKNAVEWVKMEYEKEYIPDSRFKILLWFYELKESDYPFDKNSLSIETWKLLGRLKKEITDYYSKNR